MNYLPKISQAGFIKFTKRSLATYLIVVLAVSGSGLLYLFNPWTKTTQAAWFNDNWAYRKAITFTHNAAVTTAHLQLNAIDTTGAPDTFQSTCADVRFTDANGKLLKYYLDSASGACDTASTDFNVQVAVVNGSNLIYMYYGNPSAPSGTQSADVSGTDLNTPSGGEPSSGSEEKAPSPTLYWKFNEGTGSTVRSMGDTPALIQAVQSNSSEVTCSEDPGADGTRLISFNATPGAGNLIVVAASTWIGGGGTHNSITDNQSGNTYTKITDVSNTAENRLTLWYAKNIASSGTFTLTMTFSACVDSDIAIIEYSGLDTVSPLDQSNTGTGTTITDASTGSITTATDGELYVAAIAHNGSTTTQTADSPFTMRVSVEEGNDGMPIAVADKGVAGSVAAGSHSATFDFGASRNYQATIASFKPSSVNVGNLTGIVSGSTWQTEDKCVAGKCLYFDGSDDYVTTADAINLDFVAADNITVSGWVKHTGVIATNPDYILTKATSGTYTGYKLYMDSSGNFCFDTRDGTNAADSACSANTRFDDEKWHFVTGVKEGTSAVRIYVDGTLRASDTSIASTGTITNSNALYVGVDRDGTSNAWAGFIDDVKIYKDNSVRTVAQVQADFNARNNNEGASAVLGAADQRVLNNGLTGYWKLDESSWNGTAGEVIDASGHGNNGTAYSGTTTAAGRFGRSGVQTARTHGVNLGDDTDFEKTTFTISAWVYRTSDSDQDHKVFTKGLSGNTGYGLEEYNAGSGHKAQVRLNDTQQVTGTTILAPNIWYHIAGTIDGTTVKIYVNGVLETSAAQTQIPTFGSEDAKIGNGNTANDLGFIGNLDEVRFYDRVLSPAEIAIVYNAAPSPVGYWDFEEKSGSIAYDRSGNNNAGTLTNSPTYTNGKYGSGLSFAGSNAQVTRADDADFDFGTATSFSYSAWIKHTTASALQMIMAKYDTTAGNGGFKLQMESDGDLTCGIDDDETSFPEDAATSTAATYDDGLWHHVDCVKNGTTGLYLYIDGVLIASDTSISSTGDFANADPLYFGIAEDGTSNDWVGQLDEVKIYNYARSAGQVIEDMNGGHPSGGSPIGSQVAYWKFDEGYGTTGAVHDSVKQNGSEDLDLSSVTGWTNSGKFGKAFNGATNIRASRTDDSDLDFAASEDFSLSLWFKSDSATNPSVNEYLLEKGGNIATDAIGYAIYTASSGGTICFGIDDDALSFPEDQVCSTADLYDNTWHHIVAKKTGTSRLDLYVDGLPDGTPDIVISSTGTLENAATFYIGDTNGTDDTDEFLGDIDEVKVYRLALSAAEVKVDRNQGSSEVLGAAGNNSNYEKQAANQAYCIPGDTNTCTAPILEWKFDESTGTSAQDTSGNGRTGTLTAGPTWTTGKVGSAINFDGVDDKVEIAANLLGSPANVTLEGWFNLTTADSNGATVLSIGDYVGINAESPGCGNGPQGFFYRTTPSADWINTCDNGTNVEGTGWHHIAYTFDDTANQQILYIDGVWQETDTETPSIVYTGLGTATLSGRNGNGSTTEDFKGRIDQIRVYNYARTPAQIWWDMNKGAPYGWWKFDECLGTTINDSSGNAATGTLTVGGSGTNTSVGTCTSGSSSQAWANGLTGKRNYSMRFDGVDDYIDLGNMDITENQSAISWSYWVKPNTLGTSDCMWCKFQNDTTATTWGIETGSSNSSAIRAHIPTTNTLIDAYGETPTGILSNGTWSHVAVVFNGTLSGNSNRLKVYVNGRQITLSFTGTIPAAITSLNDAGTNDNAFFGRAADITDTRYFNGQIDDARLYLYPLTQSQIQTSANDGATRFGPDTGAP